MLDEKTLKARLSEIRDNNYVPPTQPEIYPLVLSMGNHIGSIDPVLRDDLIYMTLVTWISRKIFSTKELKEILNVLLNDQHLFKGLGEKETDTVFTRSFSMLQIQALLEVHRKKAYLPHEEMHVIKQKVLRYLSQERDLRGFVPVKGWAHAIAHTADVLVEMVQCDEYNADDLEAILAAIQRTIVTTETVYICEEDERLATAVLQAWQRPEIDPEQIKTWLQGFIISLAEHLPYPGGYYQFVNSKNFLRSLYLRAVRQGRDSQFRQTIYDIMSRGFERY
ncbi:MAG: DUF2785 domain-containing protein [Anaerolineales bacterium]|nr:DUF2785 domain-containing protein [Anaerolineales bacterium]